MPTVPERVYFCDAIDFSMKPHVIIDNGHGSDTAGKCSPDRLLQEWKWTRAAARRLAAMLNEKGIGTDILVPEESDISLRERCRRANAIYRGNRSSVLVSLHSNASGDGSSWGTASGWSAFVAPAASENSQRLARLLYESAVKRNLLGDRYTPPEGFHRANLAICRDSLCPAVLTENMFHDNRADAGFLLSEEGISTIAELHEEALCRYFGL